jgi:hypothetical protein
VLILLDGCSAPNQKNEIKEPLYSYDVEERLVELGIELSEPKLPKGVNIEFVRAKR